MKPEDDPEARIRELERPLADTARASEAGSTQPPGGYPYPPGPAAPPPPPVNYGTSFPPRAPRPPSSSRLWVVLAAFFVIGLISVVGSFINSAHRSSRGGLVTLSPTPSISASNPAPTASPTQTPSAGPATTPPVVPAPASQTQTIAGINEVQTLTCNASIVSISGVSNTVVIHGHCQSLTVSGVQNKVTVDAVDSIEASGFNNQITYHTGSPSIDKSGDNNVVQQG
jgi:hypothetical protein